jgi:hypothetical protein
MNGWPVLYDGDRRIATGVVPGVGMSVTLRNEFLPLALALLVDLNRYVVPLRTGPLDGLEVRQSRTGGGFSNHASGTAFDIHYDSTDPRYPAWPADHGRHCSAAQIRAVHTILDRYTLDDGTRVIGWGGDWTVGTYCDEMHFEVAQGWEPKVGRDIGVGDLRAVIKRLRIRPDGTIPPSPKPKPKPVPPPVRGRLQLTDVQIAQAALTAGFTPGQAVLAVAVALAESGGDAHCASVNHIPGSSYDGTVDRGLWQINSKWSEYPDAQVYEAVGCARAAWYISKGGTDWTPWTTFRKPTPPAYKEFLVRAMAAVNTAQPKPKPKPAPVVIDPTVTYLGATNANVKVLQRALNGFGAALTVDGAFGPATLAALQAFQRAHGISPVSAKGIGNGTVHALGLVPKA